MKTEIPESPKIVSFENILADDYEHQLDFGFLFWKSKVIRLNYLSLLSIESVFLMSNLV